MRERAKSGWQCRTVLLCAAVLATIIWPARAQTSYSREIWPEIDLVYHLNDRDKFIGLFDYSRNRDSGVNYQAEAGLTFEHKFTDFVWARIGYRHGTATNGGDFEEDRLLLEQTFRVALPALVMVDFRTREDFRWLNTGYSMRFRERIQVQRDTTIGNYTFTPYASTEIYFDTRYGQFARYRLIAGTSFPIGKHFAFEPYFAHQVDFAGSDAIVNAVGLILTVSF